MKNNKIKEELLTFLYKASKEIYVFSEDNINPTVSKIKNSDKSTTVTYSLDDYSLNDSYFGGEPYGGRLVVFHKNKPIWMMTYYGWVEDTSQIKEIYSFLFKSLLKSKKNLPYRGPLLFINEGWRYVFEFTGSHERFQAIEKIFKDEKKLYEAWFSGGFVDKK